MQMMHAANQLIQAAASKILIAASLLMHRQIAGAVIAIMSLATITAGAV